MENRFYRALIRTRKKGTPNSREPSESTGQALAGGEAEVGAAGSLLQALGVFRKCGDAMLSLYV